MCWEELLAPKSFALSVHWDLGYGIPIPFIPDMCCAHPVAPILPAEPQPDGGRQARGLPVIIVPLALPPFCTWSHHSLFLRPLSHLQPSEWSVPFLVPTTQGSSQLLRKKPLLGETKYFMESL